MKIEKIKSSQANDVSRKQTSVSNNFQNHVNALNRKKSIEEIEESIKVVKNLGARVVVTKNYNDISRYKKAIQEYLKNVVDNMYDMNKNKSFWEDNYFNTVNVVNDKLEELSKKLLNEESENISIVADVDLIQGLLIDLYI